MMSFRMELGNARFMFTVQPNKFGIIIIVGREGRRSNSLDSPTNVAGAVRFVVFETGKQIAWRKNATRSLAALNWSPLTLRPSKRSVR